ncbi:MAG: hypothetical protein ACWGNV_06115 [Bacteroidales bacterium]
MSWTSGQDQKVSENPLLSLREWYEQATGSELLFINGSLYQDVYPGTTGQPFLGDGQWSEGTLLTEGKTYSGLLLRYDLCKDLLVYNYIHESGIYAINLNKDKIERFSLQGHHFVHITSNNSNPEQGNPELAHPGFYEEVCRGKASLYLKRIKQYDPPTSRGDGRFIAFEHMYILKEGTLHRVSGKRSMLRVLDDREMLVRQYIREHGLILRGNDARVYQQVVEYYNSLQP